MKIVGVNIGSGSQKISLFSSGKDKTVSALAREPVWEAKLDSTGPGQPPGKIFVKITGNGTFHRAEVGADTTIEERIDTTFDLLVRGESRALNRLSEIDAIAHRIVHGGSRYAEAVEIDEEVETEIDQLGALSPLHNPLQLQGIKAARKKVGPAVRQIAVFDTAFHHSLPAKVRTYPGPLSWVKKGIVRYGFHGSSFRYAANRISEILELLRASLSHFSD